VGGEKYSPKLQYKVNIFANDKNIQIFESNKNIQIVMIKNIGPQDSTSPMGRYHIIVR
jgi:hypothetical protein